MQLRVNVSGATITSLEVGGTVPFLIDADFTREGLDVWTVLDHLDLPYIVLGAGTNVLISDAGSYSAIVRHKPAETAPRAPLREEGDIVTVRADAHMPWDEFIRFCVLRQLPGVECLAGIPGTVGAAPVQNIGAYGQEVASSIKAVHAFCLATRAPKVLQASQCEFGYRSSIFNRPDRQDLRIITSVEFQFDRRNKPNRTHHQVAQQVKLTATLQDVHNAVMRIRHDKGMLAGQHASAGSFFKNPVVVISEFEKRFDAKTIERGCNRWWKMTGKGAQVSAAYLMEQAGFLRGHTWRRAGISPDHVLALENRGNATAQDIVDLARDIQEQVKEAFGVLLEPEVRLVGFDPYPLLR